MENETGNFAAIDLGTNNCRLIIARPEGNRLKILDMFSRIVCLGEGVAKSGRLSEEAMQRAIDALKICASKLQKHDVVDSRFIATEACRAAENGQEFIGRVKQETNLDLRIISNKEEIILAFLGCSPLIRDDVNHAVLIDVGGGSTEFIHINYKNRMSPKITTWFSIPHGMMNLTERFHSNGDCADHYPEIVAFVREQLTAKEETAAVAEVIGKPTTQVLCSSGTITTIGAIHLGLPRYIRAQVDGKTITVDELKVVTNMLSSLNHTDRVAHPIIGQERADFVLSGAAILDAIAQLWPIRDITIADRGVREGIILSMYKKSLEKQTAEG